MPDLGSFSYINSEQLQRFAKQIMSNAAGYFFDSRFANHGTGD